MLQWQVAVSPEISLQIVLSGRAPEVLHSFRVGFVLSAMSIDQKYFFESCESQEHRPDLLRFMCCVFHWLSLALAAKDVITEATLAAFRTVFSKETYSDHVCDAS